MIVRLYNYYIIGLDSTVKNMVTSLRAVGELQNPAIRDRHWEQLMQATQVSTRCRGNSCHGYGYRGYEFRLFPGQILYVRRD